MSPWYAGRAAPDGNQGSAGLRCRAATRRAFRSERLAAFHEDRRRRHALIANPDWAALVRGGDTQGLKPFRKEMLGELA